MKSLKPNHFSFPLRCASALFFWVLVIEERFAVVSRNQGFYVVLWTVIDNNGAFTRFAVIGVSLYLVKVMG
ncbi:hypothetical protein HanPI659440_Chr03g0117281 [Helianthus annuus]|nr:hypothetical protein HanIR_Chr07g0332441 [Helianthus annuus]KAJ0801442.1 hypothetical protein HanPI659440_Chr03g0117281 [Helianthus annuus]